MDVRKPVGRIYLVTPIIHRRVGHIKAESLTRVAFDRWD
jgi:hypothetical protein